MATRINIEPRVVRGMVETHPRMREMRSALETRYGATKEESLAFAEDLLGSAVQRFGLKYADAMTERLARLFDLRDQASMVVEQVIGEEQMTPQAAGAKLGQMFKDMREDMAAITDPAKFAQKSNLKADLDISEDVDRALGEYERRAPRRPRRPGRTGKHELKLEWVQRKFEALAGARKKAMSKAADFAPHELWKAVTSETESEANRYMEALRTKAESSGMPADEVASLERAVRDTRTGPVTSRPLQRGFLRYRFRAEEITWRAFDAMPEGHAVYLVRDAGGEVIYVGVTSRTGWERWGEHLEQKGGEWLGQASQFEFVAVGLDTEKLSLALEHDLMSQFDPPFNKQWTYRSKFGGPPHPADIPSINANLVLRISHE